MTEVDSRCGALLAADLAFWAGVGALIYKEALGGTQLRC